VERFERAIRRVHGRRLLLRWLAKRAGKQQKYNPKKQFVNSRSAATPTRSGASNLDAIINEGTLTIGWVGPALLGILIAAFGWADHFA